MHSASTALCVLVALAAGGEIASAHDAAPGQHSIDAKLVTLPEEEAQDLPVSGAMAINDVGALEQRAQARIVSFPSATAETSKPSSVSLTQPMVLPNGNSREVGPSLQVKALADGRFSVGFHNVAFIGYNDPQALHPRFQNRTVTRNIQPSPPTEQVYSLIDVTPHSDPPTVYDASGRQQASLADAHQRQLLFVKITRG
jgi:hypothetical protein